MLLSGEVLGVERLPVFGEVFCVPQLVVFNEGVRFAVMASHFPPVCPRVHFSHFLKVPGNELVGFLAACHPRRVRSLVSGRKL